MQGDWSHEIQREYLGKDVRFDFPVRKLGAFRIMGLVLIGFAVLFGWMPGREAFRFMQKWHEQGADVMNVIFSVFLLLFVLAAFVPAAIGLAILFGRCRVEWKNGRLRSSEIIGPFRWTRRLPQKPLRRLTVGISTQQTGNAPPRPMENFSGLAAEYEDGSKKVVAMGYPKDWLLAVAEELKSYVGGDSPMLQSAKIEVVEAPLHPNDQDVLEQPKESRIQVTEQASGVRLFIPPAGLWRGSRGLFFFALLWCGFMAVFTTLIFLSDGKVEGSVVVMILLLILFWLIGLGLMAGAIGMAKRTATLIAAGGQLEVEVKGLLGIRRWKWNRAELSAIRADNSNMEVNDRPVLQLQVHPIVGKKVGLLTGKPDAELRWIATRLRQSLNLPARTEPQPKFELPTR